MPGQPIPWVISDENEEKKVKQEKEEEKKDNEAKSEPLEGAKKLKDVVKDEKTEEQKAKSAVTAH